MAKQIWSPYDQHFFDAVTAAGTTNVIPATQSYVQARLQDANKGFVSPRNIIESLVHVLVKSGFNQLSISEIVNVYNHMVKTSVGYGDGLAKAIILDLIKWSDLSAKLKEKLELARKLLTPMNTNDLYKIVRGAKNLTTDIGYLNDLNDFDERDITKFVECTPDEITYIRNHPKFIEYISKTGKQFRGIIKQVVGPCWICNNPIHLFAIYNSHTDFTVFNTPGQWEHVLPPGVGNLLGTLLPTVEQSKIAQTGSTIIAKGLLPSHTWCNQAKNALVFITFNDNKQCIPYEEALYEMRSRMIKRLATQTNYDDYELFFKSRPTLTERESIATTIVTNIHTFITSLCSDLNANIPHTPINQQQLPYFNANNMMLIRTTLNGCFIIGNIIKAFAPADILQKAASQFQVGPLQLPAVIKQKAGSRMKYKMKGGDPFNMRQLTSQTFDQMQNIHSDAEYATYKQLLDESSVYLNAWKDIGRNYEDVFIRLIESIVPDVLLVEAANAAPAVLNINNRSHQIQPAYGAVPPVNAATAYGMAASPQPVTAYQPSQFSQTKFGSGKKKRTKSTRSKKNKKYYRKTRNVKK